MNTGDSASRGDNQALRDYLARALEDFDPELRARLQSDAKAHLELISLAQAARAESELLLAAAVTSARSAGCTWEQIGAVLGMTRQSAQQRFGQPADPPSEALVAGAHQPARMVLRPLSAFNEMDVLARAGRYGWHSVKYGPLYHVVERDDRQWEHTRTLLGEPLLGAGWIEIGGGWAWWRYWARPLDLPALLGDPSAQELVRG